MNSSFQSRFDVLVVGAGPAGIAAAVCAAESGAHVGIVDDNFAAGGQIWRGELGKESSSNESSRWYARFKKAGLTGLHGKKVFHQPEPDVLLAESADGLSELRFHNLVLATGARERFLPFPGWTLPNVMGAGGLQAMVKSGLPIRGKRVVVAGTGPLLLAVAAYLHKHGAEIPLICEQAPWGKLARFGVALARYPEKIGQGLQLRKDISGIPFAPNSWIVAAHGEGALKEVSVSRGGKNQTISCDYLACGFHLAPNSELGALLGCRIRNGFVQVNELQMTSVERVSCAGEPTGIGGVDLALVEGQIAGFAAAGKSAEAQALFDQREKYRRFARLMDGTFCLRSELRNLAGPDTLVCRCEDVSFARLQEHCSWRAAKLHTRCGMGSCQGRICGPATQFLFKWNPDSVRPPVFPARVESLTGVPEQQPVPAVTGGLQ